MRSECGIGEGPSMPMLRMKCTRLVSAVLWAAILALVPMISLPGNAAPAQGGEGSKAVGEQQSRITYVTIAGSEPAGTFGGVAYKRTWGTVTGVVAERDTIQGFDQLPHDADGNYPYQSEFAI